jgi:hypothetical protein
MLTQSNWARGIARMRSEVQCDMYSPLRQLF